jgi:glycosyltransferase involved in cell wall biosynthesis
MIKLGRVQDLAAVYRRADVVVNPVRGGTGLNVKTIEALGRGMPVVTTPSGARGLEAGAGTAFLVADSSPGLAAAVVRVFEEPHLADRLASEAYSFARRWNSAQVAELRHLLDPDSPR